MRQLAGQDVAEDLSIAVGVCGETRACCDSILIEDSQTTKLLELGAVVVGEAERVVRVQPAVVGVTAVARAAGHDLRVAESLRHGLLEGRSGAHVLLCGR